jgi:8-oxo-dGTP diphosphatase
VLRHTKAIERSLWTGPDAQRPLNDRGSRDALALVAPFAALGLTRVVTSDAVRCVETVWPYVGVAGARLELQPVLSEEGHSAQPHGPEKLARALLADGARTVVCSHRSVLPELIAAGRGSGFGGVTRAAPGVGRFPGLPPPRRRPRRSRAL